MNIAIIGAGIIGVTTAYELAADGHAVTVFERRASVAEEASFANAGAVAPGCPPPWETPSVIGRLGRHVLARHPSMRMVRPLSAADLNWLRRASAARHPATATANLARLQRMALYSRHRLHEISQRLDYTFDRSDGYLVLLRSEKDRRLAQASLPSLREIGVPFHEISASEARQIEPALHPLTSLAGALYFPQNEVANCRQFAVIVRDAAEQLGARFEFNTQIEGLDKARAATLHLAGEAPTRRFDAVVLCAGAPSTALLKPLGLRLPLRSVYGYSISAPLSEPSDAPRSGVMDEHYKVSITRLGQRVRVAGIAEIGGRPHHIEERAMRTLYKVLADWFPSAARLSKGVQVWKGARPALPDGPPVIGASGIPGLWLNLGHGDSGWSLACGCARALADQMGGHNPQIDMEGLGPERIFG